MARDPDKRRMRDAENMLRPQLDSHDDRARNLRKDLDDIYWRDWTPARRSEDEKND